MWILYGYINGQILWKETKKQKEKVALTCVETESKRNEKRNEMKQTINSVCKK